MPKNPLADFAPKLVEITEKVLFGDVWERPQLSKRDRSLITCAALVALGKTEQMKLSLPSRHRKRCDAGGVDRAHHPSRVLRGLAERLFRRDQGEGAVQEMKKERT